MWVEFKGDAELDLCASDGCGGKPTSRFEINGIGSNYCYACRERIENFLNEASEVTIRKMRDEWRS